MVNNMFDRMRAMVIRNLNQLGEELEIRRTVSTYDPATSSTVKVTTVYKTLALRNSYRNFDLRDSSIKETDVNFYVSPAALTPLPDPTWVAGEGQTEEDRPLVDTPVDTPELTTVDSLLFLGKLYTTINVRPWNHSGVSIGFKVQGRVAA